jgi:hypothetical protein
MSRRHPERSSRALSAFPQCSRAQDKEGLPGRRLVEPGRSVEGSLFSADLPERTRTTSRRRLSLVWKRGASAPRNRTARAARSFCIPEVARDRTCRVFPRRRSGAARQPCPSLTLSSRARPTLGRRGTCCWCPRAPRTEFGPVHHEAMFADGTEALKRDSLWLSRPDLNVTPSS